MCPYGAHFICSKNRRHTVATHRPAGGVAPRCFHPLVWVLHWHHRPSGRLVIQCKFCTSCRWLWFGFGRGYILLSLIYEGPRSMRSPTLNHSTNTRSTAHPRRPDPKGARQQATSFVSTHRGLVNSPPRSEIGLLRFRTETVPLFGRSHPLLLSRLGFSPSPLPLFPPMVITQARTSQAIPAIRLKVQYLVAAKLLVRACSLPHRHRM